MRQTTRRLATTAMTLSLLLAGSATLAAQEFRGGRERAPGRGVRAALAALDLTDAQKVKVRELLKGEKPRFEALREEGRAAREALRAASRAESPDPAAVGSAFLRVQAHRKTVRAEMESSRQKIEALLTPEQRAKLEGLREGRRAARGAAFGRPPHGERVRGPRPPLG